MPSVDRSIAADARASLNEATGEVVLPMDKYWYSDRENVLVNNAVAFLIEDCVEASGHTMRPWGETRIATRKPAQAAAVKATTHLHTTIANPIHLCDGT